jgi:CubicO group peptidase (beta-lactamase class C family)
VKAGVAKVPSYLLGSITKPIVIAAMVSLFDEFGLSIEDSIRKYLPDFPVEVFDRITIGHLLTHTSGLPDQLPNNAELRSRHAPLCDFVDACKQLTVAFEPGEAYEYSSMGILLAAEIAQRIAQVDIAELVQARILKPLGMRNSALGMGMLSEECLMPCQVEFGAPEAGGGRLDASTWNWNSSYWRSLGAPWGGAHASAEDVAKFLEAFLQPTANPFRSELKRMMITNWNAPGIEPRGLGFDVDMRSSGVMTSEKTFGHSGSTGTMAWADPATGRICVVLTTLPAGALPAGEHPRDHISRLLMS